MYTYLHVVVSCAECWVARALATSEMAMFQTLNALWRMTMVVLYIDPRDQIPGQLVISGVDSLIRVGTHGISTEVLAYVCNEACIWLGAAVLSVALDYYMRDASFSFGTFFASAFLDEKNLEPVNIMQGKLGSTIPVRRRRNDGGWFSAHASWHL